MRRPNIFLVYLLIFCSGFAALLYELMWMRELHLIFGVSGFAVATVLTAYMLGLALGSALFGRIAERTRDLMTTYAFVEIGIGVTAVGSMVALDNFHLVEQFYYGVYADAGLYALSLARLALCMAILILPTLLIGGTIPIVTKYIVSSDLRLGREFSTIYYANALGALLGVVATGFVLIRWLGVTGTYSVAVGINISIGLAALTLRGVSSTEDPTPAKAAAPGMLSVLFCSGFIVFGYELVWLRLLAIYGRATTYSLTVVLAGFLAGIALGSFIFSRYSDRLSDPFHSFCRWALASAALGIVSLTCFSSAGRIADVPHGSAMPFLPTVLELSLGFLVSLAVALPFGVLFPLTLRLYAGGRDRIGSRTGAAYAVNTAGAICGSLITGFWLIPALGLQRCVELLIVIQLGIVLFGLQLGPGQLRRGGLTFGFLVVMAAVAVVAVLGGSRHYRLVGPKDKLLFYEEGLSGTVTVLEYAGRQRSYRELLVDSDPVAGTHGPDVVDAKLLAHIPLLLADRPKTAVTVGFGSGGTSHSMHLHGVDVTAVEIEEAVVRANEHFHENSRGILEKAGFRLVVDDARSFMLATQERFDVIVTDATNIKYKGNPSLFTVDYFLQMKARLSPGGVAGAWVPVGGESFRDLRILAASFYAAFPHTTVWFYSRRTTHFVIFVGTEQRLAIPIERMRMPPGVQRDLQTMDLRGPVDFASMLLLGEEDVARVAEGVPLHTDNHPVLEYSDMDYYMMTNSKENLRRLLEYKREPLSRYFVASPRTIEMIEAALLRTDAMHRSSIGAEPLPPTAEP